MDRENPLIPAQMVASRTRPFQYGRGGHDPTMGAFTAVYYARISRLLVITPATYESSERSPEEEILRR